MSDLLSSSAPLSSDISMLLQLGSLGIIILGFAVVKRRNFKVHGVLMFLATLANTASILVVMVPVALSLADISIPGFNFLFRAHIILGLLVEGVAVYIVADWRFQNPGPTCFQRKNWMLTLTLFWIAELIAGMLLYMRLYQ
jgi:uncharacterized membrane protein YozB (DUF420 family)